MRVLAYDPVAEPPAEVPLHATWTSWSPRATCITLHLPLTADTHHLVDAELARRATKPGAVLINCGRGGLIDLDAALAALQSTAGSPGSGWTCSTPSRRSTTRCSTTPTSCSPRT